MANLPASSVITSASATEGDAKLWFTDIRTYIAQFLGETGSVADALKLLGTPLNGTITKTGTYTATTADRGKLIKCNGTWVLSLPSASVAGDGFTLEVANVSTGIITIDPYLDQTINGQVSLDISQNESVILYTDGLNWMSLGGGGAGGLLRITRFATAGSGTYTPPSDTKKVLIRAVGGGGGGGSNVGAGGGAGGYAEKYITDLVSSYPYTVGAAGGVGGSGGATTIANMVCSGGSPGSNGNGGSTSASLGPYGGGGGGSATGGDINLSGNPGNVAMAMLSSAVRYGTGAPGGNSAMLNGSNGKGGAGGSTYNTGSAWANSAGPAAGSGCIEIWEFS